MGVIQELEAMKYHFILNLLKNEERYDKKKTVITALDTFELCRNRYLLMQQILLPLKKKLGDRVEVNDISFVNGMQEDTCIVVKYIKNDKQYVLAISNLDFQDINIVSSDLVGKSDEFKEDNKGLIIRTFKNINRNMLDEEFVIPSTTGKFIIRDNCDSFIIKDNEEKFFSIESKYSSYEKNHNLNEAIKINCNYPRLKEILEQEGNVLELFNHLHFYDDLVPKTQIKKLTYR